MEKIKNRYIKTINHNANILKYALLHIEREDKEGKNIYYEADFINKNGLHTIYYGLNTKENAPEYIFREYGFCKILGVRNGKYVIENIPSRGLVSKKKSIIDKVNKALVEKYISIEEKVYEDHVDYVIITKDEYYYVQTIYTVMDDMIVRMIVIEANDDKFEDLVSKTTFTITNHNAYTFKEYNRYLSVVNRFKDKEVLIKEDLLNELGSIAKAVYKNIELYMELVNK